MIKLPKSTLTALILTCGSVDSTAQIVSPIDPNGLTLGIQTGCAPPAPPPGIFYFQTQTNKPFDLKLGARACSDEDNANLDVTFESFDVPASAPLSPSRSEALLPAAFQLNATFTASFTPAVLVGQVEFFTPGIKQLCARATTMSRRPNGNPIVVYDSCVFVRVDGSPRAVPLGQPVSLGLALAIAGVAVLRKRRSVRNTSAGFGKPGSPISM